MTSRLQSLERLAMLITRELGQKSFGILNLLHMIDFLDKLLFLMFFFIQKCDLRVFESKIFDAEIDPCFYVFIMSFADVFLHLSNSNEVLNRKFTAVRILKLLSLSFGYFIFIVNAYLRLIFLWA